MCCWYTNQVDEGITSQPSQPQPKSANAALAGHDFLYYWRHVRLPLLIAFVIGGVLYIFEQQMLYVLFVEFIYVLFVGWSAVKLYKGNQAQVIITGVIAGLTLGLALSLFKLFFFWKLYLFFNIVTETLVTGLAGLLAGAALYQILHRQTTITKSILPDRDHPDMRQGEPGQQTHREGGDTYDSNS